MSERFILYDKPECPFCWRVRMALHRCGIEVERRDYQVYEAQWRELSSAGTVPVLVIPIWYWQTLRSCWSISTNVAGDSGLLHRRQLRGLALSPS
jgi:glutaredoxin